MSKKFVSLNHFTVLTWQEPALKTKKSMFDNSETQKAEAGAIHKKKIPFNPEKFKSKKPIKMASK